MGWKEQFKKRPRVCKEVIFNLLTMIFHAIVITSSVQVTSAFLYTTVGSYFMTR